MATTKRYRTEYEFVVFVFAGLEQIYAAKEG